MCPKSCAGFRFDLGPLLQGQMWFFISAMAYISLVIGRRLFVMLFMPGKNSNNARNENNERIFVRHK